MKRLCRLSGRCGEDTGLLDAGLLDRVGWRRSANDERRCPRVDGDRDEPRRVDRARSTHDAEAKRHRLDQRNPDRDARAEDAGLLDERRIRLGRTRRNPRRSGNEDRLRRLSRQPGEDTCLLDARSGWRSSRRLRRGDGRSPRRRCLLDEPRRVDRARRPGSEWCRGRLRRRRCPDSYRWLTRRSREDRSLLDQ